jgi:Z1 domain
VTQRGAFDRRGLVVGLVQSGKTANYTGLICKAIDAGYQLVIVLAGVHNSLRSQTQGRLDEEILGFDTAYMQTIKQGGNRIGVAALPGETFIPIASLTTRLDGGDFKTAVAKGVGVAPGAQPMLLVVKKNVTVLRNIISYFSNNPVAKRDPGNGNAFIDDVPLLVIDDEADHASVNTREMPLDENGQPDGDYDPTRINELIRRLLTLFKQKVYVGYTATPFANIFIYPDAPHPEIGPDLFPRGFIINLPTPSNYFGPVEVFGIGDAEALGLPIVRPVFDSEDYLPTNHKKTYVLPAILPSSLQEAIRCFILSSAIRRVRGDVNAHNSMLIHVTRFVDVQSAIYSHVESDLSTLKQRLRYGEGAATLKIRDELHGLWERDYLPTSLAMGRDSTKLENWNDIDKELLPTVEKVTLKQINGTAGDVFDYRENQEVGVNVIAIGGDKLSRGLTLEGLSVSYYLRASKNVRHLDADGALVRVPTWLCGLVSSLHHPRAHRMVSVHSSCQ